MTDREAMGFVAEVEGPDGTRAQDASEAKPPQASPVAPEFRAKRSAEAQAAAAPTSQVKQLVEPSAKTQPAPEAAPTTSADREARSRALFEENERAEDERARAAAERMRDSDEEDDEAGPRDLWATVRRLWSEAKSLHWRFYVVFASVVLYTLASAAAPAFSARVIDQLWEGVQAAFARGETFTVSWDNCGRAIAVYLAVWMLACGFYSLQSYLMSSVAERLNLTLRNRIAQKLSRLPLAYFDAHKPGEIVSRATNDLDKMSESLQRGLLTLLTSIGGVVAAVAMMFYFSVPLTCIFLVFSAASLGLTKVVSGRTASVAAARQELVARMTSTVEEGYSGRLVIRSFNREQASSAEVHEASSELARVSCKADFLINAVGPAVRFVGRLAQIVIAVIGCGMFVTGQLTVGVFQAFFQYIMQASEPLTQVSFTVSSLSSALASVERVFDLLDEEELVSDAEAAAAAEAAARELAAAAEDAAGDSVPALAEVVSSCEPATEPVAPDGVTAAAKAVRPATGAASPAPVAQPAGRIAFEHVRFGYSADKPLMKDVSFVAEPGQKIAIVGTTGAGKTTLINLLMRFYEIDGGRITLDGRDTRQMTRAALRQNFGMVLQDAWLFDGTIADNIAYGCPGATREEVMAAARAAQVDFFVRTMPHGYDTRVANDAESVSQGQRQLLTIARVLLANPRILILDEATSSVDTRTELAIGRAMDALMRGRTSFVIAHRLSTIVDADLILVMDHGNIIEQGTHDQLLAAGGSYADLYLSQFS